MKQSAGSSLTVLQGKFNDFWAAITKHYKSEL